MSVRLKISVLRLRQLSIAIPLRCPGAEREDTTGAAGAQIRGEARVTGLSVSAPPQHWRIEMASLIGLPGYHDQRLHLSPNATVPTDKPPERTQGRHHAR